MLTGILKHCKKCNKDLDTSLFGKWSAAKDGLRHCCKVCWKSMPCYLDARKKHKAKKETKEYMKNYLKDYYQRDTSKEKQRERTKELRSTVHGRTHHRITTCLTTALQKKYHNSPVSEIYLGCTLKEFKIYMQALFKEGMSWSNYGEWHIDHKLPCNSFDFTKDEDVKECFHYSNLQPLWALENRIKSDKIDKSFLIKH